MRRAIVAAVATLGLGASALAVPAGASDQEFGAAGGGATLTEAWSVELSGWNRHSSPAIGDLDGDGTPEIVVGHQDGYLRAYELDGTLRWSSPATIVDGIPTAIDASPTIHDFDGDGKSEIVVGAGSTWVADQNGGIMMFDHDGTMRWRYLPEDIFRVWGMIPAADGYSEGVFSTAAIGDVDGDGSDDIVFGGWDLHIHALDKDGNPLAGFPLWQDDTVWSSPALVDANGDGDMEILIGGDSAIGGVEDWTGGVLRMLDHSNGELTELWKQRPNEVVHGSPAVGDINGDGRLEVLVTTGEFYSACSGLPVGQKPECGPDPIDHDTQNDDRKIFAWHLDDGSTVPGWPVELPATVVASPVLGDMDADGKAEVVTAARDGKVHVVDGDGQILWSVDLPRRNFDQTTDVVAPESTNVTPVLADVTGDNKNDIIVPNAFGLHVIDGATQEHTMESIFISAEASAAVFDHGGQRYLVVPQFNQPLNTTLLTVYKVAGAGKAADWPVWRRSQDRTGTDLAGVSIEPPKTGDGPAGNQWPSDVIAGASTPSGEGYWVVKGNGVVEAYGDAEWFGDAREIALNGPIQGMAPTGTGNGYWLVAYDGGVFSYGDADFFGSMGGATLNAPVFSMTSTPTGNGYWLVAFDGGIFAFGDAADRFYGSMGGTKLNEPITGITGVPAGNGYRMIARDGGVFAFGATPTAVPFYGSLGGQGVTNVVGMTPTHTNNGYWVLGSDGKVYAFGDAAELGDAAITEGNPAVAIIANPDDMGYRVLRESGASTPFGDAPGK
ncbi:MAG: FG-GAP-like repeat-containing protein [Actinomycetota bacterium]